MICLGSTPVSVCAQQVRVATVAEVLDGNTVIASRTDGTTLRVRLLGIDAPELARGRMPAQPLAEDARDHLLRQVKGKVVRVQQYGQDASGRTLAVVWLGPVNINALMVMRGLAEVFRGAPCQYYCEELLQAEGFARQQRLGIWAQGATHESPADFRRRHGIHDE